MAHYASAHISLTLAERWLPFWVVFLFVKIWRPKTIRGFGGGDRSVPTVSAKSDLSQITSARGGLSVWLPYIVLVIVVVAWTGPWSHLPSISLYRVAISAQSSITGKPISSVFNFAPLSGGTAILASWLVLPDDSPSHGISIVKQVFARTFKQMWGALLVAFFVFAMA